MPSVDSLWELLEALASGQGLPPDALYAQLNPWACKDDSSPDHRATLLASLSALARKPDARLSHLASLALGYLGGKDGFYALARLITDPSVPATHRENAADALTKHYGDQLDPHSAEFETCMLLQTQRVLRLVAEGHTDARAMLRAIIETTAEPLGLRGALEPLIHATRTAELPLASVWGDFAASQNDPMLRRDLINLIAQDRQVESADFIATLETQAKTALERKELRNHLHALRDHGVQMPLKASKRRKPTAVAFGVDGDACASLFLFLPEKMGGSLVSFVIHLTSGLRDGFVRSGLGWAEIEKEKRRFLDEADLAGTIAFSDAVRIVEQAIAHTPPSVLRCPDVSSAVDHVRPHLQAAGPISYPNPAEVVSENSIRALLNSDSFGYWFFEAVENTMAPALAALAEPPQAVGKRGDALTERIKSVTEQFLSSLVATGERQRVSAMLLHQSLVLHAAGQRRQASLCSRLAHDVRNGEDAFLRAMAARSLVWAMEAADTAKDEWARRYDQCHTGLRQVLQDDATEVTKRTIAKLDLGAQVATALVMRNRRLPSSARAGLHSIESAALEMVDLYLDKREESLEADAAAFEAILHANQILPEDQRALLGKQALQAITEFVERRCNTCAHQCLKFPGGAADGLLFSTDKPWEVPLDAVARVLPESGSGGRSPLTN